MGDAERCSEVRPTCNDNTKVAHTGSVFPVDEALPVENPALSRAGLAQTRVEQEWLPTREKCLRIRLHNSSSNSSSCSGSSSVECNGVALLYIVVQQCRTR